MKLNTIPAVPAIFADKLAMMATLGELGISKDHDGHNYKCRSIVQALAELNNACVKHGVTYSITETGRNITHYEKDSEQLTKGDKTTKKSGLSFIISATFEITLISLEDGSSISEEITTHIDCKDVDKAAGKLSSYALKEWFFKSLAIPDEGIDDPDYYQAADARAEGRTKVKKSAPAKAKKAPAKKTTKKTTKEAAPKEEPTPEPETEPETQEEPVEDKKPTTDRIQRYTLLTEALPGEFTVRDYREEIVDALAPFGVSKVEELTEDEFGDLLKDVAAFEAKS